LLARYFARRSGLSDQDKVFQEQHKWFLADCRLCYQHIIPGIEALGLTYTYAEKVFGFIVYRDYLPHNHGGWWIFSAVAAVNNIGLSGASPGVLKGMSARQISDLYGLDAEQTEGLRTLLQKSREHSDLWGRATGFAGCVLGRFRFQVRYEMPVMRLRLRIFLKKIVHFLVAVGMVLCLSGLFAAILLLSFWLHWPENQTALFLAAATVLVLLGIRPGIQFGLQTRYGRKFLQWCRLPR